MNSDKLKLLTAIISVAAAAATFILFAETNLNSSYVYLVAIAASAYAAAFSLVYSRTIERNRARKKQIFIIHAREDSEQAINLADHLKASGFNPWLDVQNIVPGQRWEKAVLHALEQSVVALFLSSENTVKADGYFSKEIQIVMESFGVSNEFDSPIIPVRLDDTELPQSLSGIQWLDLYGANSLEILEESLSAYLLERKSA